MFLFRIFPATFFPANTKVKPRNLPLLAKFHDHRVPDTNVRTDKQTKIICPAQTCKVDLGTDYDFKFKTTKNRSDKY